MTPGARVQAAIDVLEAMAGGLAAEQALTRWARGARYAGSKDRAAVRDHVFSVLRCKRSCAALGGGTGARALMLGLVRATEADPDVLFTGEGHAPPALSAAEREGGAVPSAEESRDLPDWLWSRFEASLGATAEQAAAALRHRAPVFLRLNPRMGNAEQAIEFLTKEGISVAPVQGVDGAFEVTEGARRISQTQAFKEGRVELQDASSQAAMAALEVPGEARVLDYCAGGGGKVLALAARHEADWFAHDAMPERMQDLPARAARAGVTVSLLSPDALDGAAPFDLVLCDVPCSGSGTWRRTPEAKWTLTPERLRELCATQTDILKRSQELVRAGGGLAYTTCSVLAEENEAQVTAFLDAHPGWTQLKGARWPISDQGDGFFLSVVCREQ